MDIQDLRETAALARLNLGDAEIEAAFPAFGQMLGYFEAMRAADHDGEAFPDAEALSGDGRVPVESGFFRSDTEPDAGSDPFDGAARSGLTENAGGRDGPFIVVPNVL